MKAWSISICARLVDVAAKSDKRPLYAQLWHSCGVVFPSPSQLVLKKRVSHCIPLFPTVFHLNQCFTFPLDDANRATNRAEQNRTGATQGLLQVASVPSVQYSNNNTVTLSLEYITPIIITTTQPFSLHCLAHKHSPGAAYRHHHHCQPPASHPPQTHVCTVRTCQHQ